MTPAPTRARLEAARDGKSRAVEVCASCLTASCWHGVFMCDKNREAGTTLRSVAELDALALEHPSHYAARRVRDVTGR